MRYHRNKRKALFVPQLNCPVPLEQLANYRRTVIRRPDGNNEVFTEQFKTLDDPPLRGPGSNAHSGLLSGYVLCSANGSSSSAMPVLSSLSVYDEGTERGATLLRFGHLYPCRRCKELIPYRCHASSGGGLPLVPFYQLLLDDDLDLLDFRFLFNTGEHFRFLHDDPVVDYLRTSNGLRPASPVCGTLQGKP